MKIHEQLGSECIKCGVNDERVLCIDHIFGGGSIERKKFGGAYYRRVFEKIKNGTDEYQLLCCNCNQIKKIEEKETQRKYE